MKKKFSLKIHPQYSFPPNFLKKGFVVEFTHELLANFVFNIKVWFTVFIMRSLPSSPQHRYIGNYFYLDDLYIDQTFLPFLRGKLTMQFQLCWILYMFQYTVITKYCFYNQILKGGIWFTIAGIHNKWHIIFLQALYTELIKVFYKLGNFHISLIF